MFAELSADGLAVVVVAAITAVFAGVIKVTEMILKYRADQRAADRELERQRLIQQNTAVTAMTAERLEARVGEAVAAVQSAAAK